jgi:hypothetical protein
VSVVRDGDWKLLEYLEDGRLELYNLRDDLSETNNLAESEPEKARELHGKLQAWRQEINAPLPTKNTPVANAEQLKAGKKGKKNRRGQGKRAAKQAAAAAE